jgi:hypothetical protein
MPPIRAMKIRLGMSTAITRPNGRIDTNTPLGPGARIAETRLMKLDTPSTSAM